MINNSPFAQVIENMKKNGATEEEVNHVQNALDNSEKEMQQKKEAC